MNSTWAPKQKEEKLILNNKKNCTASVTEISAFGLVTIEFNATVQGFQNASLLNNLNTSVLDLYVDPAPPDDVIKRNDSIHLNFTWKAVSFNNSKLLIQISFGNNTSYISPYFE